MELVFKKQWDETTDNYQVIPYTADGQPIENCTSCVVKSFAGEFSTMTLTIEKVGKFQNEEESKEKGDI